MMTKINFEKKNYIRTFVKMYSHSKVILNFIENLIETQELDKLIRSVSLSKIRILDCSWFLPTENKNSHELFIKERIPFSQFFDIDLIADKSSSLPHMMPDIATFVENMKRLDIRLSDHIICYDRIGIFSAPRVWYTFKLFGANKVSVLNGGFPKWKNQNLEIESGEELKVNKLIREKTDVNDFDYKFDSSKLVSYEGIIRTSLQVGKGVADEQIIDCRSPQRYNGEVEEPRPTLRKGHVDHAQNVFFKDLLDENSFKSTEKIKSEFEKKNIDLNKNITVYCGSGTTACINIFALTLLGKYNLCKLYDGSWSEMGNVSQDTLNQTSEKIIKETKI